jgi:hypothetical protein
VVVVIVFCGGGVKPRLKEPLICTRKRLVFHIFGGAAAATGVVKMLGLRNIVQMSIEGISKVTSIVCALVGAFVVICGVDHSDMEIQSTVDKEQLSIIILWTNILLTLIKERK